MEDKINDVYEVFKDYYGEDRVDLQRADTSGIILVHFPRVTVTNENNNSVDVTDLYIKTVVHLDGTIIGQFEMTRGSYPLSQVKSGYMHSHARRIPEESFSFSKCCLGRGPIIGTIAILTQECDLDRWALYCYELDKYTQVESLRGIPWHRLENISSSAYNKSSISMDYRNIDVFNIPSLNLCKSLLKRFIPYLINKKILNFAIINDHFYIAHPFTDYMSKLTTTLVEYLSSNNVLADVSTKIKELIDAEILIKGLYENGRFYIRKPKCGSFYNPKGKIACRFKGSDVVVTVTDDTVDIDDSNYLIINPIIANYILYRILISLNYEYSRRKGDYPQEIRTIII